MEKIAEITGVLCISVFIMGLLYQLGGFEKTAQIIRFTVALCIISTTFAYIKDFKHAVFLNDITFENNEYDYNIEFYSSVIYETQEKLEEIIKSRLDEKNISYNEIDVHIFEQNGVVIADEIVVVCDDIYKEDVYNCIHDMLTDNTKVIIGE